MEVAFGILLGAGFLLLAVWLAWALVRLKAAQTHHHAESQAMLRAAFRFQRELLEAEDEEAILRAAMRTSMELLRADGVSFVPFDEWRPALPAFSLGAIPLKNSQGWGSRLQEPATRQACKLCRERQAVAECVLLEAERQPSKVWCTPLRQSGREIGMLNYYFNRQHPFALTETLHFFLAEMVPLVDLALQSVKARRAAAALQPTGAPVHQVILEERARLAREIHDGLAQTLAFLKMEATRMQAFLAQGQTERLTQTLQGYTRTLADAYLDARQAIDDLRHAPGADLGDWLVKAGDDFRAAAGIPVNVHVDQSAVHLTPQARLQLARIVQEALANVRKHAEAGQVWLRLLQSGGDVLLEIQDDGLGFSPEKILPDSRYGLRGMRERAESIGADFQVVSRPGNGTTVQVRLPLSVCEVS